MLSIIFQDQSPSHLTAMATFIPVIQKLTLKIKLIGSKPEIFAGNIAWIWCLLKRHRKTTSSRNSSKAVGMGNYCGVEGSENDLSDEWLSMIALQTSA